MDMAEKRLNMGAWALSFVVSLLAITVWEQSTKPPLTIYKLFPIFGLLAFSLMWSHYIVSVIRQYLKIDKSVVLLYFNVTSWIVLIAIALHPSLLIYQLYRDGLGLPPGSYEMVYGWVTLLGTGSWFVFIAYEFRRKFGQKKWWKYIEYLGDLAMLTIFYHGLHLGTQLHIEWFRWIWYFYGVTLVGALSYIYAKKLQIGQK